MPATRMTAVNGSFPALVMTAPPGNDVTFPGVDDNVQVEQVTVNGLKFHRFVTGTRQLAVVLR